MTNLIIIHGEKPKRNGQIHPAFIERLESGLAISKEKPSIIILTGGKTRKNVETEAEMGKNYLQDKTKTTIYTENKSRTTIENINFTRKLYSDLIEEKIDKIYVITSKTRILRIKYLYSRLWKNMQSKAEFVGSKDYYSSLHYLLEIFYLFFDFIDIKEKYLSKWAKKFFRNG